MQTVLLLLAAFSSALCIKVLMHQVKLHVYPECHKLIIVGCTMDALLHSGYDALSSKLHLRLQHLNPWSCGYVGPNRRIQGRRGYIQVDGHVTAALHACIVYIYL